MAEATKTRQQTSSRWSMRPPQIHVGRSTVGAVLALSAWLLQSYFSSFDASRIELRSAIRTTLAQREMWQIEYNSSLVRQPRSDRLTARAALELIESTREFVALSQQEGRSLFQLAPSAPDDAGDDVQHAQTLFEQRNYRELVKELDSANAAFEELRAAKAAEPKRETAGLAWWRHAFPVLFLIGVGLTAHRRVPPSSSARDVDASSRNSDLQLQGHRGLFPASQAVARIGSITSPWTFVNRRRMPLW